jgi:transcriptional regulator with XRE-family HTH domain
VADKSVAFAAYLGIAQGRLSRYEKGSGTPSLNVLLRLKKKCGKEYRLDSYKQGRGWEIPSTPLAQREPKRSPEREPRRNEEASCHVYTHLLILRSSRSRALAPPPPAPASIATGRRTPRARRHRRSAWNATRTKIPSVVSPNWLYSAEASGLAAPLCGKPAAFRNAEQEIPCSLLRLLAGKAEPSRTASGGAAWNDGLAHCIAISGTPH